MPSLVTQSVNWYIKRPIKTSLSVGTILENVWKMKWRPPPNGTRRAFVIARPMLEILSLVRMISVLKGGVSLLTQAMVIKVSSSPQLRLSIILVYNLAITKMEARRVGTMVPASADDTRDSCIKASFYTNVQLLFRK